MTTFKVINAEVYGKYLLRVTFDNNEVKLFNIRPYLKGEIFKPLNDPDEFAKFHIDELGSIEWDSGASLSFDTLYIAGTIENGLSITSM